MLRDDTPADLAKGFEGLSLSDRLARVRAKIDGRIVFTTSFGLEDQAIAHEIFTAHLAIDVVTLDTGRMFPETYAAWAQTENCYGRRIAAYYPRHDAVATMVVRQGINGFYESVEKRHACCHVRKVEPLGRALAGAAAWITGIRAQSSAGRAEMTFFALDDARGLVKVNPLLDWSREQVAAHIAAHGIPYNVLHDTGFASIGCQPCTRPIAQDEPERAGRWWWEQDLPRECGLHVASDGRPVRSLATTNG
jgi:phosphoadenosine phosphosulfate reductase